MCRNIEGNRCGLGRYCHCHPVPPEHDTGYDDGYSYEQDDTTYRRTDLILGSLSEQGRWLK